MKQKQVKIQADKPRDGMCEQILEMAAAAISKSTVTNGSPPEAPAVKTKAEHWANLIQQNLRRSVYALLEAGKHLICAKEQLEHGEWLKLFHQNLISLNEREAQRLMQVARNPVLSKANSCSLLPPSPQALSALSQADPAALQEALDAGQINPRTTIVAAKAFLRQHPAPGAKTRRPGSPKEFDLNRTAEQCNDFLWDKYHECPKPERDYLCDLLQDIVDEMKRKDDIEKPASRHLDSTGSSGLAATGKA